MDEEIENGGKKAAKERISEKVSYLSGNLQNLARIFHSNLIGLPFSVKETERQLKYLSPG